MGRRWKIWVWLLVPAVFSGGCRNDDSAGCFGPTGDIVVEQRPAGPFRYLELHDNINLFLTQAPGTWSIDVEAGENLLSGVKTDIESGHLVIRNTNECNWVRDFSKPINVYVTFASLDSIVFRAAGELTFTNHWQNDVVQFDVWEGSGEINIRLLTGKSHVYVHYGTTDINLSGVSDVSFISNKGYGPIDGLDLMTKFTYISNYSPNDCFVYATVELQAEIHNIGNIYYSGNPYSLSDYHTSTGRLIRLE